MALRRLDIASQAVISQVGMVPTHAIAVTTNVQHGGVVQEAIDDGRGDHRLVEEVAPTPKPRLDIRLMEPNIAAGTSQLSANGVAAETGLPCQCSIRPSMFA